jgi:hypothetical protein
MTLALRVLALLVAVLCAGCHASPKSASQVSSMIGPAGGTVTAGDGSSVEIPAGALSSMTTITMEVVAPSLLPGGGVSGGAAFTVGPAGQTFLAPITITLTLDPTALPAMTEASDLVIFTTSEGTTDHAYWLATRLVDGKHLSAQTTHFSWIWIGDPRRYASQVTPPPTACGIGGAACIDFDLDEAGFCPVCQCSDGSECPGSDPSQCCACSDGTACPDNDTNLCGRCDAGTVAPTVLGVSSQSLGPNCPFDSDLCSVCPSTNPVACASGACCPLDHTVCCGDGRSCGASPRACVNADAGAPQDDAGAGAPEDDADAGAPHDSGTDDVDAGD